MRCAQRAFGERARQSHYCRVWPQLAGQSPACTRLAERQRCSDTAKHAGMRTADCLARYTLCKPCVALSRETLSLSLFKRNARTVLTKPRQSRCWIAIHSNVWVCVFVRKVVCGSRTEFEIDLSSLADNPKRNAAAECSMLWSILRICRQACMLPYTLMGLSMCLFEAHHLKFLRTVHDQTKKNLRPFRTSKGSPILSYLTEILQRNASSSLSRSDYRFREPEIFWRQPKRCHLCFAGLSFFKI